MSELSVDKITGKTGTGGSNSPLQFSGDTVTLDTGVTISSGATIGTGVSLANATFPAGHVIQILSTSVSTQESTTSTTMQEFTAGKVSITPKYQSSKFLIMVSTAVKTNKTGSGNASSREVSMFGIRRDIGGTDTDIYGPVEMSRQENAGSTSSGFQLVVNNSLSYLDTPNTTSEIDYIFIYRATYSGWTTYVPGKFSATDSDKGYTMTVMEIKQ